MIEKQPERPEETWGKAKNITTEVYLAFAKTNDCKPQRNIRMVDWVFPPAGCIKLNTDGSVKANPTRCGYGGIFRRMEAAVWEDIMGGSQHAAVWRLNSTLFW